MTDLVIKHAFQQPTLYDYVELDGTLEQTLAVLAEIRRRGANDDYRPVIDEASGTVKIEKERTSYSAEKDARGKSEVYKTWELWAGPGDRIALQGERGSFPSRYDAAAWRRTRWVEWDPEAPIIDLLLLNDKRAQKSDADA